MFDFPAWWFQHCTHNPIYWECPPKKIGLGKLLTAETLKFAAVSRSELFLRATTVKRVPNAGRGGSKLAGEIPGVWLDIDFREGEAKDFRYPPRDRVAELLAELPDPSATVETGGGLHCYWKLAAPVDTLENTDLLECWFRRCNNVWQSYGYLLDNVLNPDRLLRLPGSVNWKQDRFETTFEVNDLEYSVDDLIPGCKIDASTVAEHNWVERPILETAFNDVIDVKQMWVDEGFERTGRSHNPDGEHFLRPGSAANKSLTVWDDSGVTTIHSTVVLDHLELDRQSIKPYNLAVMLGRLFEWRPEAEALLKTFRKEYEQVLASAQAGEDTSDERWHHAAQFEILEQRLSGVKHNKQDLVRPFPEHLLPDVAADAARDAARLTGAIPEMAYTLALGFLAVSVAGLVRVEIYDTPVSLYCLVAAAPGSGKSPVMRLLGKSLREADEAAHDKWIPFAKQHKERLESFEAELVKQEDNIGEVRRTEIIEQHRALRKASVSPMRMLGRITPAALFEALSFKDSAAVVSEEGSDWIASFRDSNAISATGSSLLEIYDGHSVTKATKSDGLLKIDSTFAMLIATQSGNLQDFSDKDVSGLWQRFLYVDLPDKAPVVKSSVAGRDTSESLEQFNVFTSEILDLVENHYKGRVLKVSDEAVQLFEDWQYHTKCRGNEKHPDLCDPRYSDNRLYEALSKAHSHALRIAGLLSILRLVEDGTVPEVELRDMEAGIGISEWFYDRRVADSLGDIDDAFDGRLEDLMQYLDQNTYVTASKLARYSSFFDRNDTKGVRAFLNEMVEKNVLEKDKKSTYKRKL